MENETRIQRPQVAPLAPPPAQKLFEGAVRVVGAGIVIVKKKRRKEDGLKLGVCR
jgi:hypothetical protein